MPAPRKKRPILDSKKRYSTKARRMFRSLDRDNSGSAYLYRSVLIRSRSGKQRELLIPAEEMKLAQYHILKKMAQPEVHPAASSRKGMGLSKNVQLHAGSKAVLKIDLKSFFDSFTQEVLDLNLPKCSIEIQKWVNRFDKFIFYKNRHRVALTPEEAEGLSTPYVLPEYGEERSYALNAVSRLGDDYFYFWNIAEEQYTLRKFVRVHVLPTGSRLSPLAANLIFSHLDEKIQAIADEYGATYTRYLDDIVLSFKENPEGKVKAEVGQKVKGLLEEHLWTINSEKSGWSHPSTGFVVTGSQVRSETPKVPRKYILNLRAALNNRAHVITRDTYNAPAYELEFSELKETNPKLENVSRKDLYRLLTGRVRGRLEYVRQINTEQYDKLVQYFLKRLRRFS